MNTLISIRIEVNTLISIMYGAIGSYFNSIVMTREY